MATFPDLTASPAEAASRSAGRVIPLLEGEPCGDAVAVFESSPDGAERTGRLLAVIDGLGHGVDAARAAQEALRLIATQPGEPLDQLLATLDAGLSATRGAAIGLVRIQGRHLQHAGIGNTRTLRLRGGSMTRLPSHNGIVGGGTPVRVTINELDLLPGDWLLMFTDGIDERLTLPSMLPEWEREPSTLCDHLLLHGRVGHDDAGVLVFRQGQD